MSIYRFVTPEFFSDLEEDNEANFIKIVQAARRGLDDLSAKYTADDEQTYYILSDINFDFLNAIVAIASECCIEPFASILVPTSEKFRKDFKFRDFKAQLDFYLAQSALRRAKNTMKTSVAIPPTVKDQLRKYVNGLRECLEKSEIEKTKRDALLKRLDDFERELEKRRLSLMAVTVLLLEFAALPGGWDASYQLVEKLRSNILREVAAAKVKEDEAHNYLQEAKRPLSIAPPTKREPITLPVKSGEQSLVIDDEIPF